MSSPQKNQDSSKHYKKEIKKLKNELEKLQSKTQIADLQEKISEMKDQKTNSQISDDLSMTHIPGYEEEFARLKQDVIKQQRKNKMSQIWSLLGQIISIPIIGVIVYSVINTPQFITFLEADPNTIKIISIVIVVVFIFLLMQTVFNLIRVIFQNPEIISDQTLSYLSLTAKEHILDPKGSVIREKYGTSRWTTVTQT